MATPTRTGMVAALAFTAVATRTEAQQRRVTLQELAPRYGWTAPAASANAATCNLRAGTIPVRLEAGSRRAWLGGTLVWMNEPASAGPSGWTLGAGDVAGTLDPILRPAATDAAPERLTIVIDPGHGGDDTGAISPRRVYEKKVVRDIARRLRRKLGTRGRTVRLTRLWDQTLSLETRTERARRWGAHVFLSLHMNAASNAQAAGVETYVCTDPGRTSTAGGSGATAAVEGNRHNRRNLLLAYSIQRALVTGTDAADRGVRRARFLVLQQAPCPAALVECGFLSNPAEEARFISASHRDAVAAAIAKGVESYLKQTYRRDTRE